MTRTKTMPAISDELRRVAAGPILVDCDGGGKMLIQPPKVTPALIAEAREVLPALEAALAPPPRAEILDWLRWLALACRPVPEPEEIVALAGWMAKFSDLPATAYTPAMVGFVGNRVPNGVFPGASVIRELVWPTARADVDLLDALRWIARGDA